MRKVFCIFVLFIGFTIFLNAQNEKIKVACVGNSITAGAGIKDTENDSYPAVLGRLLGDGYEVKNFGFSGRTMLMKGDRPYMMEDKYQEALEFSPDIVIIKLGTNDSKPQNWEYKEYFKEDMLTMINSFSTLLQNPKIYLCYPAKAYSMKFGINDSIIVNEIIPLITEISLEKELEIIDLHTALDNMPQNFPDDIHPNEAGAVALAAAVYNKIRNF